MSLISSPGLLTAVGRVSMILLLQLRLITCMDVLPCIHAPRRSVWLWEEEGSLGRIIGRWKERVRRESERIEREMVLGLMLPPSLSSQGCFQVMLFWR